MGLFCFGLIAWRPEGTRSGQKSIHQFYLFFLFILLLSGSNRVVVFCYPLNSEVAQTSLAPHNLHHCLLYVCSFKRHNCSSVIAHCVPSHHIIPLSVLRGGGVSVFRPEQKNHTSLTTTCSQRSVCSPDSCRASQVLLCFPSGRGVHITHKHNLSLTPRSTVKKVCMVQVRQMIVKRLRFVGTTQL